LLVDSREGVAPSALSGRSITQRHAKTRKGVDLGLFVIRQILIFGYSMPKLAYSLVYSFASVGVPLREAKC